MRTDVSPLSLLSLLAALAVAAGEHARAGGTLDVMAHLVALGARPAAVA